MSTQPRTFLSEEEYLEIERAAERKSEYFDGEMFAMAGGSVTHAEINSNLVFALRRRLAGSECRVYFTDLRVKITHKGAYAYPDIVVVCGKPEFHDSRKDTIINPTVIIETLSPSTRNFDRGDKFAAYRAIPSLRDYLMIEQTRVHAEHWVRTEAGWLLRETSDAAGVISLDSIGVRFSLGDAYEGVEL